MNTDPAEEERGGGYNMNTNGERRIVGLGLHLKVHLYGGMNGI